MNGISKSSVAAVKHQTYKSWAVKKKRYKPKA
jgi:hypothetical protein